MERVFPQSNGLISRDGIYISHLREPKLVHYLAEWQEGSIKGKDDTTENGYVPTVVSGLFSSRVTSKFDSGAYQV